VTDGLPADDVLVTSSGRILSTLNWLRAAVLGANDGVVSTAAIIFGVAGASAGHSTIMLAGIAAIAAGALSMAAGEYVSVSTQRDLEVAELARQKANIERDPEREVRQLAKLFEQRGVKPDLASEVSRQMSAKDALSVHARAELGIDPEAVTNPWAAAFASLVAFTIGGLIPIASMLMSPGPAEIWVTGASVVVAMALTGAVSAKLGQFPVVRSMTRNVVGGLLAMAVTYGVGNLVGGSL
jgi:VIT1/CCC1 family predicted Fe2+/Mn2+ transporter